MARYRIENTIVNTDKAHAYWEEDTKFNGNNNISVATGSQWAHQRLYRSRKGRYYTESWSQYEGSRAHAEWVSPQEAVRWLLLNDHKIPEELDQFIEEVEE
jgi:hypothetical protein